MSDFREGRLVRFAHQKAGGPVHRVSKRVTNSLGEFVELEDMVGQFAVHLFVSAEPEAPASHRWSGPNVAVPPCPCPGEGRFDPYRKP